MIDYPEAAQRKIDAAAKRDELRRKEFMPSLGATVPANSTVDIKHVTEGAQVGMAAVVTPHGALDASWAGVVWACWVSATNEVTIRFANLTGSQKTLNTQQLQVRVLP